MRRLLLITLCMLLPLKAMAAVVVAIAGVPDFSAPTMTMSMEHEATSAHCLTMANADSMAGEHGESDDTDHPCPHLGMATVGATPILFFAAELPVAPPTASPHEFVSVVLDVPLQPPSA